MPPLAANFREFSESSLGIFHEIFPTFGPYYQQICGKEGKFAVSLGRTKAKMLTASGGGGALPPDPLTRGSALDPAGGSTPRPSL